MQTRLALLIGAICLIIAIAQAQTEYAALLRVDSGEVQILRANTQDWLSLPVGAEAPLGVGDVVRTDFFGRAWITLLDESATVFVLPTSDLTLSQFSADENQTAQVAFSQNGRVIYDVADSTRFTSFQVITDYLTVWQPADLFAVQTLEGQTSVIVADGEAIITQQNTRARISATPNIGVRANPMGISAPIRLTNPTTFAQLDGVLDGCVGVIQTRNQRDLNVRVGPTENYDVIGTIRNGDAVAIVGISPNGERYRVVYESHFGWILALEVRSTCDNLPVYDYNTLERQYGVIAPSADEQRLLTPFFGLPTDDDWFYYGCDEDC
ncbi:MAG: SH3 domain-containing protein [Anaerolineae bacterium]|nr:SH3 domain-containing protein [Anaerolineae bacterium]